MPFRVGEAAKGAAKGKELLFQPGGFVGTNPLSFSSTSANGDWIVKSLGSGGTSDPTNQYATIANRRTKEVYRFDASTLGA